MVNQSVNLLVSSNRTLGDASRLDTNAISDELDTSAGTYLHLRMAIHISTIYNFAQCLPPHHYQLPFQVLVTDQGVW